MTGKEKLPVPPLRATRYRCVVEFEGRSQDVGVGRDLEALIRIGREWADRDGHRVRIENADTGMIILRVNRKRDRGRDTRAFAAGGGA